jgi:hypothetical protein
LWSAENGNNFAWLCSKFCIWLISVVSSSFRFFHDAGEAALKLYQHRK